MFWGLGERLREIKELGMIPSCPGTWKAHGMNNDKGGRGFILCHLRSVPPCPVICPLCPMAPIVLVMTYPQEHPPRVSGLELRKTGPDALLSQINTVRFPRPPMAVEGARVNMASCFCLGFRPHRSRPGSWAHEQDTGVLFALSPTAFWMKCKLEK